MRLKSVRTVNCSPALAGLFVCAALWAWAGVAALDPPSRSVATHTTFNGDTIAYAYDSLNRLVTKTLPGGNAVSYTYTPTGQVETVTDVRGPTRYTFDLRDRLTKVEHPEGWVVEYGYDEAGNRTSVSTRWPGEVPRVTSYTHDGAGRIVTVTGPGGELTTFGYDAAGNRTSAVLPNGITTTWAYDARNRVTRIEHKTTATGTVQAFYESTWNAQGLRATQRYSQAAGQGCLATYTYGHLG